MESDVLYMVSPYQKRIPSRAPSDIVVSGKNVGRHSPTRRRSKLKRNTSSPCVLDHEAQIMLPGKFDSFLDVTRCSCIDTDYRHAPLLTREAEGGVEITALDRSVGKGVRLEIGVLGSTRMIRTPDSVVPVGLGIGAVSCGRIVTRSGRRDRMDQWLRDFRRESLELRIRWPTCRCGCTAAVSDRLGRDQCQAESDGQERCEEKHECTVRLGCTRFLRVLWVAWILPLAGKCD